MGLFKIFKRSKSASDFKNSEECKNLLSQIELHNKELKVVRKEYFGDQIDFYLDGGEITNTAPSNLYLWSKDGMKQLR